jgi:hypothetical protein
MLIRAMNSRRFRGRETAPNTSCAPAYCGREVGYLDLGGSNAAARITLLGAAVGTAPLAARALGLTVLPALLACADAFIE